MAPEESFDTASESLAWLFVASFGLLAIVLVWTLPERWVGVAPSGLRSALYRRSADTHRSGTGGGAKRLGAK